MFDKKDMSQQCRLNGHRVPQNGDLPPFFTVAILAFRQVTSIEILHSWAGSPLTKIGCFVGCVCNKMQNNFFVDGCGCQEFKLLPKKVGRL